MADADVKSPVASLQGVTKAFGGRAVIRDLSLSVGRGEVIGVIGANGSGKTTLLRLIVGLICADSGSVTRLEPSTRPGVPPRRVVFFAGEAALPDELRVGRWARLFGVGNSLANDRRRFGALSRGQRQQAGLRIALAAPFPALVVLDEPWDGLDPDAADWLSNTIAVQQRKGVAFVVSSHRLDNLAHVQSRCVMLRQGVLCEVSLEGNAAVMASAGIELLGAYRRSCGDSS